MVTSLTVSEQKWLDIFQKINFLDESEQILETIDIGIFISETIFVMSCLRQQVVVGSEHLTSVDFNIPLYASSTITAQASFGSVFLP